MQSAIERWKALIDARAQQMDAAYARLGRTSSDFWDRRARSFHRATKDRVVDDPLFQRLRQVVTPQTSVLDVGAGTGRFALALAPQVGPITAVEPNISMLSYLRSTIAERNLTNITCIPATWQDAPDDLQADIVICSHVLYPIREVEMFLAKLHAATRRACYIYMRAIHFDALTSHIWQHFHGDPRHLPPAYIHALDILYDMGIYADVEIVTMPQTLRYPSLDIAIEELLEQLILPDNPQTRTELRQLLNGWLVERDGILTPPTDTLASAIIRVQP
ncbi:MAG TPA: class I SAM-dependent methyltransferase [Ktedonobacteraceae bacterium]|nr:class I SAM-dependent methyltransferase [Ktedonobacteraceae bacterium]